MKNTGINKNITSHTLRHSYTTHLMNYDVDLVTIQCLI